MKPVHQIPPHELHKVIDDHTRKVIRLLQAAKIPVRIVGGAVRDMLQNKAPRDVDLVADTDPGALIYLFQAHDIGVDVAGIQHGTVKAVFGTGVHEQKVDVTSLGYRIHRHGDQISVDHAENWQKDSAFRDLTINAMSMDLNGDVYDYQNGLQDLHNQVVRLGPQAEDSLLLDPTGIMRYFRAVSQFPRPKIVQHDLTWIRSHVHELADYVDDKKVQMNYVTIMKSPHRAHALKLMCACGVNQYLPYVVCEA